MKLKLKWHVYDKPTGPFASFTQRGWPYAQYENCSPAVMLCCDDDYSQRLAKAGEHKELAVKIAKWHDDPANRGYNEAAFEWKTLKVRAKTLVEAKGLAQKFLEAHPEFWPVELRPVAKE